MATANAKAQPFNNLNKNAITSKRKAEVSPLKNDRIKRCALTNLTNNNVTKTDSDENLKKVTVFGNNDGNIALNIKPISYRTRAAAAAALINQQPQQQQQRKQPQKAQSKASKKTKFTENTSSNEVRENVIGGNAVTLYKPKKSLDAPGKSSITTRRISNEFEKTEESLYVSALEDISSDVSTVSRLSDAKLKHETIAEVSSSSSTSSVSNSQETSDSSQKTNDDINTTTSSSDVEDVFEDAEGRRLPQGVVHFDRENWNDPFQVSHYAMDIFEYLRNQEKKYQIKDYISQQPELTKWMRSLLVDWMVEVQESFELNHETLYLAIKIVDTYLSKEQTSKDSLQLLGAAALLIACKYDERTPPLVDDFLFICDGAYKRNQLLRMEANVFRTINYDLGFPLSYRFLRRYARCGKVSMLTLTLARYILEYSLMDYSIIQLSDSKMACAALFMALRMNNFDGWDASLEYYSGYQLIEFAPIVVLLNTLLHKKPKDSLSTVRNKYSHKIFHQVTSIPLLDVNALFEKFPEVTQKLTLNQLTYQSVVESCSSSSAVNAVQPKDIKQQKKLSQTKQKSSAAIQSKPMPLPFIR